MLSKYRVETGERCWACRHLEPEPISSAERAQRLAWAAAGGRLLRIVPSADFVCPDCGQLKSHCARRCSRCHFRAPHPKKVAAAELKSGPCPICGQRKSPKARLCRTCWALDQRLLFADNPALTCPDCGGPKVRKADRCRRCRNHLLYGTTYRDGRPVRSICPDCGGPKKLGRASRCRGCAVRQRRERAA